MRLELQFPPRLSGMTTSVPLGCVRSEWEKGGERILNRAVPTCAVVPASPAAPAQGLQALLLAFLVKALRTAAHS